MSLDLTSELLQFNFKMPKGSKNGMYSFDRFRLDAEKLMLYRDDTEISLAPKIVKTLAVLIENRGSILSKDELIEKVWDDSIVEESNLSQNLYILRKTLGTKPDGGQYIETLRRRGYRFNAEVKSHSRNGSDVPDGGFSTSVPLIGREKEVEEVVALLSRDDVQLVTISGVGGVGKTSIARAVTERLKGNWEVFFVELASITQSELVVSAIASALGVKESGDGSLVEGVKETLEGRRVLLVLDNFEQVVAASSFVSELLNSVHDGLKILVTSRIPLRLSSETMYVLPPLPIPETDPANAAELTNYDAVRLFIERAKQAQPDFELTSENASAVASICTQLGGLPLAIELAAARIRFMSPEAVRKRLEKKLDILKGTKRDAPARQQTMRETIAWSFELLPFRERQVFALLAVFSGGFDLPAAEHICSYRSEGPDDSILEVITSLVEHNLLTVRSTGNGEPRIQMLEVVREFAEEVLVEQREVETAQRSHAMYFLELGEKAEPQLLAARSAEWLDRLEREHDNLRAALKWSADNDPSIGQRLAGAIWRFWWLHGHIREACEQLGAFLSIPGASPETRAKMLVGATFLNRLAGNSERSRRYAEEGVELASATGDLRTGALSLNQLGFLALDGGDFATAERMFGRGLKRAEELGDIQILALLNNGLGELSRSRGEYAKAAEFYGRALEYNRKAGDRVRQTTCLINLGANALMQGDREAAGAFYRNGLEISSEMEDMNGTLYCLEGVAGSYWALHDPHRAALIFGAADAGRRTQRLLLEPADQEPYERSVVLVRQSIGSDSFDANFSKGGEIGLRNAISLALDTVQTAFESAEATSNAPSVSQVGSEQIVVERQGNVLRLVDWSASKEEPSQTISATAAPDPAKPAKRPTGRAFLPWAAAAAILVAAGYTLFFGYRTWSSGVEAEERRELSITRLTNANFVRDAAISPDGNFFVYNEDLGESSRVWLQQTGTGTRKEIIPEGKFLICCKTFSPDGKFIYFTARNGDQKWGDLYRIATLGGTPEKVLDNVNGHIGFSPDGDQMIFLRHVPERDGSAFYIAAVDGQGGEREILSSNDQFALLYPAWSPDGKRIAFASQLRDPKEKNACTLSTMDLRTGSISPISGERWGTCYRIEWLKDGSGFAMVGTREGETNTTNRDQVYLIGYPDGRSRRLTTDGNRHEPESLGVTTDGAIFTVSYNRSSQIWSVDANGDSRTAVQLTTGTADGRGRIAPLPDGRIGYTARSADEINVWIMNADGSNQIQVGDAGAVQDLSVTPDGRYFIYSDEKDAISVLYRIGVDGTGATQLTKDEEFVIDSAVSPDGSSIIYDVWKTGGVDHDAILKRVPFGGGEPVILSSDGCSVPFFSRDGEFLSCVNFANSKIAVISAKDGSKISEFDPVKWPHINSGARFTPDGKALVYIVHQRNVCNVWKQPFDGSKPFQLTDFSNGACYNLEYSWDGTRLYLARGDELRDAMLIRGYK